MDNGKDLQSDSVAETYAKNEIQNSKGEMTKNLNLEQLGFQTITSECFPLPLMRVRSQNKMMSAKSSIPTSRNAMKIKHMLTTQFWMEFFQGLQLVMLISSE